MTNLPIRVVLIEDQDADAILLKDALTEAPGRYIVCEAKEFGDVKQTIDRERIDVIITSLTVSGGDLRVTVSDLCKTADGIPIIVVTRMPSDDLALPLIDQGAQDFLLKDEITPERLHRAIQYAIRRNRTRLEIKRLLAEVQAGRQLLEKKNQRLAKLYKTAQRFVNNVSHEFRTPLTVIREYTDLLREGILGDVNDQQCRYLETVVDRADDLNRMVDDMLDVTKLESGLLGAWRRRCHVEDVIEYHRTPLMRKAVLKDVTLDIEVPSDLPAVYCDAEKVGRVIVNLTVNAIKFSKKDGHVKIWARFDPSDNAVAIGVTDDGPGIDPECQKVIFKRFRQLKTGCCSSTLGVGLGLNIAQELVEMNLGEMRLESQVGMGSTFLFTLPSDDPKEVTRRYLRRMRLFQHSDAHVSLVGAAVDDMCDPALVDEVDAFFNYLLRRHDLLFRTNEREWLLIVPERASEIELLCERIAQQRKEANRNRPDGALPEIVMRRLSTWPVQTDESIIMECLSQVLEPRELIHA